VFRLPERSRWCRIPLVLKPPLRQLKINHLHS
jgi:hypothetical protein